MRVASGIILTLLIICGTIGDSILADNNPLVPDQVVPVGEEHKADSQPIALMDILAGLGKTNDPIDLQVDKSEREMHVLFEDSIVKSYTVVLGLNPEGDKEYEGDRKTPEGLFTFRDKYPHKEWHKFIWVDYPNTDSWTRFKQGKSDGTIPAEARIGGEIGIHGVPQGMDEWIEKGNDWTFGCIGMRNSDIDEIYPLIKVEETTISIVP